MSDLLNEEGRRLLIEGLPDSCWQDDVPCDEPCGLLIEAMTPDPDECVPVCSQCEKPVLDEEDQCMITTYIEICGVEHKVVDYFHAHDCWPEYLRLEYEVED